MVTYIPVFKLQQQGLLIDFLNIIRPILLLDFIGDVVKWDWFMSFNKIEQEKFEKTSSAQALDSDF